MPLEGDEPKVDADKITVLASNNVKTSVPSKKTADYRRQTAANSSAVRRLPSAVSKNGKPQGKAAVLDDAMRLRSNLRETLVGVNSLIQSIKSQRRQDKLLRDTVSSLRKLQKI